MDGADYRYGTTGFEIDILEIFYFVEGKQYIKYIPVQSGEKVNIYYNIKNPNDFMCELEYQEKIRYSKTKKKICFPALILSIFLGLMVFVIGINILNYSLSENYYYHDGIETIYN